MTKDWSGNGKSTFITIGASNHTDKEREEHDFYATSHVAIDRLVRNFELPKKDLGVRLWYWMLVRASY